MTNNQIQETINQQQTFITNVIKAYVYIINRQRQDTIDYILIKSFLVCTANSNTLAKYQNKLDVISPYMPLEFYNPQLPDQQCYQNMMYNHNLHQPRAYSQDQLTYIKYCLEKSFGCQHYVRGCQVRCNQCMKFYTCRYCHNEAEEHLFPRYETDTVKCMHCGYTQPISGKCVNCQQNFGRYCHKCKLIDGLTDDGKPIFHCDKCNTCNVGFQMYSIHCDSCSRCIQKNMYESHTCVYNNEYDECPICLELVKEMQDQIVILKCGHTMHLACAQQLQTMQCPYCRISINLNDSQVIPKSQQLQPQLELGQELSGSFL